eukprot:scaffold88402_cov28-Tisochrysis_lutea.AAC.4
MTRTLPPASRFGRCSDSESAIRRSRRREPETRQQPATRDKRQGHDRNRSRQESGGQERPLKRGELLERMSISLFSSENASVRPLPMCLPNPTRIVRHGPCFDSKLTTRTTHQHNKHSNQH